MMFPYQDTIYKNAISRVRLNKLCLFLLFITHRAIEVTNSISPTSPEDHGGLAHVHKTIPTVSCFPQVCFHSPLENKKKEKHHLF